MPKVAFGYTGCKLNKYEIQLISESLKSGGFEIVSFGKKADCYVINTCSVTGKADVSSRQLIRRSRRIAPDARVVVTGCYAQLRPEEIERIGVELIVSNREKETIATKIFNLFGIESPLDKDLFSGEFCSDGISSMSDLTRAFVKIQEGCDRECTYCTIRVSRGPSRSRDPRFIIPEINRLYKNGYKEIVLTGVHIGCYSFNNVNLPHLLRLLLEETEMPRIRLSSLNPSEVDDELIELIALNRRICPYVHLSIQSGDDDILSSMGRSYSRSDLLETIGRVNDSIPNVTVGADIIVGFPGESDSRFQKSYDLVERSGIHHLHVFRFSPRPGTKAVSMPDEVPNQTRKRRVRILRGLGRKIKNDHLKRYIGEELRVLFENRADLGEGFLTGLSDNYLRVRAVGEEDLRGIIIGVRPYSVEDNVLCAVLHGEFPSLENG